MAFCARYAILSHARTAALVAVSVVASAALYGAGKPLTVALVFDGLTPAEREPLRAYLTRAMGRPVNLAAPDLYKETVAHVASGSYDFACLGAFTYVRAHAKYGVIPLVRPDLQSRSVFITGTNSSIHALRDLSEKRFAFGDINATSTRLIAYGELVDAGINPETDLKYRYSGSHVATAALVESGVVDAGVLDETIFDSLIGAGKLDGNKVRIFHTSKLFVSYAYVAGRGVPEAEQKQFARALLSLTPGKDDAVLKILRAKRFVVANDQEYADIRQLARKLKLF